MNCRILPHKTNPCEVASMKDNQFELHLCGDYRYALVANGSAEIGQYTGQAKELTVPETLGNHPVISIGEEAFRGCKSLTSIVLPEGLEYIAEEAFQSCESLSSITLPKGLKTIERWAFDDCRSLRTVEIPSSVELIGYHAFHNCSNNLVFKVARGSYAHQWADELK